MTEIAAVKLNAIRRSFARLNLTNSVSSLAGAL